MPLPGHVPALLASGGLTDVNLTLTIATLVLFVIFAFVLGRFGWAPLLGMIEEREKGIREAVEGAHKANTEAQALLLRHQDLVREAGREREEILKRALHEAETLKNDVVSRAREESERLLLRAKDQIQREKNQAILEVKGQVADLAVQAAAKIVTSSLTPDAQRKLVSDFIEALPKVH
jgi:F-type H+-transporting ATPase subunit b